MITKHERIVRIAKKRTASNLRRKHRAEERRSRNSDMPRGKGKSPKFHARQGMKRLRGARGV